jgi:putative FmdB family regulatory protein
MMPIYTYACDCGSSVDVIRTYKDDSPVPCAACKKEMKRQLSAPLFRFKGRVTPGGGPDRYTADTLGIPLKELPKGLKS